MDDKLPKLQTILERAREIAIEYHGLTGKPLGITGEIGEFEAARLLGLELAPARAPGYDAVDPRSRLRFQIKARAIGKSAGRKSQRVGQIKLTHDWDAVLLVLLDDQFRPFEIHEAGRAAIEEALQAPGSKARNERGALAVSKFKSIGRRVWPVPSP
ncbi:MAG: hypothetical protein L0210_13545 [Rhodospirillales bacterium]|nr:hypothetical protein [Rhodospirillales bacterium]